MKPQLPGWLRFGQRSAEQAPQTAQTVLVPVSELYVKAVVVLLLTLGILISALLVIYSAHQYRQEFNHQQQLVAQWDELQVEWGQLQLEQGALAASSRVENLATKRLGMQIPATVEVIRDER